MMRADHFDSKRIASGLLHLALLLTPASVLANNLSNANDYYAEASASSAAEESKTDAEANPSPTATNESHAIQAEGPGGAVDEPVACSTPSFWSKVPPVEPIPRAGLFIIPPTGAGYYWAVDAYCDNCRDKPPISPYRLQFYDNDFRYLENPDNQQVDFLDPLKRIHLGDDWMLSLGGEERVRYMMEDNAYLRITGRYNDYTLLRSRLYADLWYQDRFRIYAEYFDAEVSGEDLPPQKIDVDKSDFLNLFADVALLDCDGTPVYARVGRQELCYGSQRLISALDWANTRRTFQGAKAFWHTDEWDLDAFWTQPVIVNPTHFDSPDDRQDFAGAWATYKPVKGTSWDWYYLYLDNRHPVATGIGGVPGGINVNTLGSRYAGDCCHVLWDFEGMYQYGSYANQNISAGAFTTSVGYQFADLPYNPQMWVAYDWASGTQHPGTGDYNTFNQLFPFGHYYFGYLDLVGRENISDFNMQFLAFPANWVTSGIQFHVFDLVSSRDALYNAGGTAIARDATGTSGHHVGNEIDLFNKYQIDMHQDLLVGYSQLFEGEFLERTKPTLRSPELFYTQYSYKW
jgi:hypothetical protein